MKYIKYTKDTIKKGAKAGVYNPNDDIVNYNYLIGDFGGSTVTLINIKTGMIHTCEPSDIYMPDGDKPQKNYLDYDQECMAVGDKVTFRLAPSIVFEITKITPTQKTCNLFSRSKRRLFDIPLSYLRFANEEDSVKKEHKVIKLKDHSKKEKSTMNEPNSKVITSGECKEEVKKETIKPTVEIKKETVRPTIEEEFSPITITIKPKDDKLIVKVKDELYNSVGVINNFKDTDKNELKKDIKNTIDIVYDMFINEDMRKRNKPYIPNEGDHYLRFLTISDEFSEKDLGWKIYDSKSFACFQDLEFGNMYRDGHEAKVDYPRIKNEFLQKRKQIIEKQQEKLNDTEE